MYKVGLSYFPNISSPPLEARGKVTSNKNPAGGKYQGPVFFYKS